MAEEQRTDAKQEADFTVVEADSAEDSYADDDSVPGEFRRLTDALGAEQVAITLIRVPPYSDFEQGTGSASSRSPVQMS